MARAEVGDDVYGEDPTVTRARRSGWPALFGHEAALFTPDRVDGQRAGGAVARRASGRRCSASPRAHIARAELGAHGAYTGLTMRTWTHPRGQVDLPAIQRDVRPRHGAVLRAHRGDLGREHPQLRRRRGAPARGPAGAARRGPTRSACGVHLDGARIWNAHVATGVAARRVRRGRRRARGLPVQGARRAGRLADGRHAPTPIAEARVWRKRLGGGMRQVGILAAAGPARPRPPRRAARRRPRARPAARRGVRGRPGRRSTPTSSCVERADAAAFVAAARGRGRAVSAVGPTARADGHPPRRLDRAGRGGPRAILARL